MSKDENENLHNEVDNLNNQIIDTNKQIDDLNNTYNNLSNNEDNKDLILEYSNWKHHKEKLEKVMDY